MTKLTDDERGFRQGVAITVANMLRLHDNPVIAQDTLLSMGYTYGQFVSAGVEEYDLAEIRRAFRG